MTTWDTSTVTLVIVGSSPAELLEDADEHRDQEDEQRDHHADREDDHQDRVDHRRADLAAQRGVLLELVGDAQQRALEHAADLAGRVIATNSGLNTFGWRAIASLSDRPASTSLRTATIVSLRNLLSVCSSSTYSARRMLMPEEIIVASWREKIARSVRFDALQEGELDLARGVLVGDVEDDQPARLQLVGDRLLGVGVDLAARLDRRRGRWP